MRIEDKLKEEVSKVKNPTYIEMTLKLKREYGIFLRNTRGNITTELCDYMVELSDGTRVLAYNHIPIFPNANLGESVIVHTDRDNPFL